MLSFLTADEASVEAFLSVSAASPYQPELRAYAHSLLSTGCTRQGWCLLGLDADVPVARAALWALPTEAVPSDVVLIDANWAEPDLAGGHALLKQAHELAADLGARELQHHVDSPPGPPQYQERDSERVRLLTEAGYDLQRDGLRWLFTTSDVVYPPPESSLTFRGLSAVGEEGFVEALAATYEGTRDSILTRHIREHGLLEAARLDFADYQHMEYLPEWWELAYTEDGALAGVIMGARTPSSAVIGYVGVVPQQRGRGFAAQLVRRGTRQLVAGGASEIRGDCDSDNVPMIKAFHKRGLRADRTPAQLSAFSACMSRRPTGEGRVLASRCKGYELGGDAMLGAALVIAFLVVVGPLAYFFGVDSRPTAKSGRDWWPARPRR